jgi:threonine/homoserine/homoserine lactone efflux protein
MEGRDEPHDDRILRYAAVFFLVGFAVHNADHIRRGYSSVTPELFWAGNLAAVVSITAIVLVLRHHRLAARVAVAAGFPLAIGFTAAHMLPTWSVLSDSFLDQHVSVFSWVAALLEITGALVLAFAGLAVLRRRRQAASDATNAFSSAAPPVRAGGAA